MADRKTASESPRFTIATIEKGIDKLRSCTKDLEGLGSSLVQQYDPSVQVLKYKIRTTIHDVFGEKSLESKEKGLSLLPSSDGYNNKKSEAERREESSQIIDRAVAVLKGFISRLEEKHGDLEAEQKVDQSGAPSSDDPTLKTTEGHCPRCERDNIADILGDAAHNESWEDGQWMVTDTYIYTILQCRGCKMLYVKRESHNSEEGWDPYPPPPGRTIGVYRPREHWPSKTYWPAPAKRKKPDWLYELDDQSLRGLLNEVYGALDADHCVLAAIGIRTVLEQVMVSEGADPAPSFQEKLKELKEKGVIGKSEKALEQLIDAGNAAAHRNWKPTPEKLTTLFDGMESFLHRFLVLKKKAGEIKPPSRPERPKKDKTVPGADVRGSD